jgi:hypothetical protein
MILTMLIATTPTFASSRLENARLDSVDANYAAMSLRDCVPNKGNPEAIICNGAVSNVKVNDLALRARLKEFHIGDHIRVDINDKGELEDIRGFWSIDDISPGYRILVLVVSALVLLGLATAATKGVPLKLIVGEDNRYSNSKFQVALWFWVLMSSYLATVVFRVSHAGWDFFGRVSIPQNLLLLSGLSALTYGGAKAITTAKVNAATKPQQNPGLMVVAPVNPDPKNALPVGHESLFRDLIHNDVGGFDFGDFQMLVVTLIAVGMYLVALFHFLGSIQFQNTLSLPDLDTTVLAAFGLGQGAYLTKKAAGNVGTS